jgi:hypothetical protein
MLRLCTNYGLRLSITDLCKPLVYHRFMQRECTIQLLKVVKEKNPENILGPFREHSGPSQGTFWAHSGSIPGPFRSSRDGRP